MADVDDILEVLKKVKDPELQRDIVTLEMVKDVAVKDAEEVILLDLSTT